MTDGRATAYSEREREFTFANIIECTSTVLPTDAVKPHAIDVISEA